jgi:hypothetical protein
MFPDLRQASERLKLLQVILKIYLALSHLHDLPSKSRAKQSHMKFLLKLGKGLLRREKRPSSQHLHWHAGASVTEKCF